MMKLKPTMVALSLAALLTSSPAFAQSEMSAKSQYPLAMEAIEEAGGGPVEATVTSINSASRKVTLEFPNGKTIDTVVKRDVENLQNVDPGDKVVIDYVEALVVTLEKVDTSAPGTYQTGETVQQVGGASDPGLPAESYTHAILAVGVVEAVDTATRTVTLDRGEGLKRVLHVPDTVDMANVAVGDTIKALYVENISWSMLNKNPLKPQME